MQENISLDGNNYFRITLGTNVSDMKNKEKKTRPQDGAVEPDGPVPWVKRKVLPNPTLTRIYQ